MAGLVLLLALCGCVLQMGITPEQRAVAVASLRTGQARLSCLAVECAAAWGGTRNTAAEAAASGEMETLAVLVQAANYDQDLGWYYLGMAAAGLGYKDAARTYLDRSIQRSLAGGSRTCRPDDCDGFELPANARTALASLRSPVVARAPRRRAPTAVAPAAAASDWISPTPASAAPVAAGPAWVAPVPSARP